MNDIDGMERRGRGGNFRTMKKTYKENVDLDHKDGETWYAQAKV